MNPFPALFLLTACATGGPALGGDPVAEPTAEPAAIPEASETPMAAPAPAPAVTPEELAAVAAGDTAFAVDLYKHMAAAGEGNLFLSPASISTALAMTRGGARGATAEEMDSTLHFSLPQDRLHPAYAALDASLRPADAPWQLSVANRLWGQVGLDFEQPFLDLTREHYGAELASVNFSASEPARQEINAWVSEKTHERIPELIPQGAIDGSTTLVLTNAIHFLANWMEAFDPANTSEQPFTKADGKELPVPLMHAELPARWHSDDALSVLALPYDGDRLELLVVLPAAHDGLPALESSLSPETLGAWDRLARRGKVKVWLPRFEQRSSMELSGALRAMGMPSAFGGGADFTGMVASGGLFISAVLHEAWLRVDEVGTEAAAATAVVMTRSARAPQVPTFRADHPFLYFIRDRETGTVLFMGRMVQP